MCCHLECHIYDNLRATGWNPQKHLFFQKTSFWLSSKSSQSLRLLGQLFCVFMWIIIEIFTRRSRSPGSSDMEKSLHSCCPIRQNPDLLQKDSIFFFRFIFVFSFFFDCFFRFCFRLLSNFLVFESHLTKSKNCQKKLEFSSICFVFSRFFSFFYRIIFEPRRHFQFIFELFSTPKKKIDIFSN